MYVRGKFAVPVIKKKEKLKKIMVVFTAYISAPTKKNVFLSFFQKVVLVHRQWQKKMNNIFLHKSKCNHILFCEK